MNKPTLMAIALYILGATVIVVVETAKGGFLDGAFTLGVAAVWASFMIPLWPMR